MPARREGSPARAASPIRRAQAPPPASGLGGSEGVDAGDVPPEDQRVDVVGALVGVHRFEVGGVPHRVILQGDAVPPEDGARLPRHAQRHPDVVALGHAHLGVPHRPGIHALVWMSWAENPGVCGSTRNPRTTPSSALAQTSATSAIEPLVIHILVPSSDHPPETRRARVCIAPGSLPAFGSVRPKHPIFSPAAIAGSQALRCSSLPYAKMGYMTSAPCTEANDRTPLSPRSSSCMMSP